MLARGDNLLIIARSGIDYWGNFMSALSADLFLRQVGSGIVAKRVCCPSILAVTECVCVVLVFWCFLPLINRFTQVKSSAEILPISA